MMQENNRDRIQRFFELLSTSYKNGDLDVRGIITMVILNSLEKHEDIRLAEEFLSEEVNKVWKYSRKLKGKNIKPEKLKRTQKLIAEKSSDVLTKNR